MSDNIELFTPMQLGDIVLSHRIVMAPMTRIRANTVTSSASQIMAIYYSQRATSGGLIITEASHINPQVQPIHISPGIYNETQIQDWQHVVDEVHKKEGKIFLQLWHVGRVSHSSFQPNNSVPVAPSAMPLRGEVVTKTGQRALYEQPKELTLEEIKNLLDDYKTAAANAKKAGFDGVEIHAANGWLLEQFLQKKTNTRTDIYGGSVENRCRFVLQVVDIVCQVYPSQRVGIRLSPFGRINDSGEDDPISLYTYLIQQLDSKNLSYLHLVEPRSSGAAYKDVDHQDVPGVGKLFRNTWNNTLIVAGNFGRDSAIEVVNQQHADAVAFGRLFVSNPDLVNRLKENLPLSPYNRSTFYQGNEQGYIDYPEFYKKDLQ
jgi:N-ethylmaleimide reductase